MPNSRFLGRATCRETRYSQGNCECRAATAAITTIVHSERSYSSSPGGWSHGSQNIAHAKGGRISWVCRESQGMAQ
jgi:hypothetical protein